MPRYSGVSRDRVYDAGDCEDEYWEILGARGALDAAELCDRFRYIGAIRERVRRALHGSALWSYQQWEDETRQALLILEEGVAAQGSATGDPPPADANPT